MDDESRRSAPVVQRSTSSLRPTMDIRAGRPPPIVGSTNTTTQQHGQASPVVFDLQSAEELQRMIHDFPIVVVDVWAPYCNPCRMLMPKFEKIARKYEGAFRDRRLIFVKDNIEVNADIHKPLVRVVPTFFVYVHGERYHISSFGEIEATVDSALMDVIQSSTPSTPSPHAGPIHT